MNNIQRFYDLNAKSYATEWYSNELLLPSIKQFISLFDPRPKILDLGCGPGHESMRLTRENAIVTGIDFSCESINIAKAKNPEIQFYCMDYFQMDSSLGQFDGIFSCASLIHLREEELKKLLEITSSILVSKGYFLVLFMKGSGQKTSFPEINGEKIERTVQLYTPNKMKSIFELHNYEFVMHGYLDSSVTDDWDSLVFRKTR